MLRGLVAFSIVGVVAFVLAGCGGDSSNSGQSALSYHQQVARALKEPVPDVQAGTLMEIGAKQGKAKDLSGAEKTLELAAKACRKIQKAETRATMFARLAEKQIGIGERSAARRSFAAAREAADQIEDPESTARTLATLGATQGTLKDVAGADQTLKAAEAKAADLKDPAGRISVLNTIAAGYQKIAQEAEVQRVLQGALATALAVEDGRNRTDAIAEVAATQAKLKRSDAAKTFDLARASARKIENPYSQAYALMEIAKKLSKAGRHTQTHEVLAEAAKVTKKIPEPDLQRETEIKVDTLISKLPRPA